RQRTALVSLAAAGRVEYKGDQYAARRGRAVEDEADGCDAAVHDPTRAPARGAAQAAAGGAASEATLRDNHRAMSHYEFVPRVLRDVSQADLSTTFLGMPLALPVMTAPMGWMYLLDPDGDVAMARAAGRMGTIHWLSSMTAEPPAEVAAAASGPLVFQLYFRGD